MNGILYGRFMGILFLVTGLGILGIQYYSFREEDTYSNLLSLGFVLSLLGLAMIGRPGPAEIRFDFSDDYDDRQDKGRAWLATVSQQRALLWLYGGAMVLGLVAYVYVDLYLQGRSLTDWTIPLRIIVLLGIMVFVGWRITRSKKV